MNRDEAIALLTAPGQQFEVTEATVLGVGMRVWKNAPPSMRSMLEASRAFGDRDFLVYDDDRWTYESHFTAAAGLARWMIDERRLRKGDRVGIAMRNYPEWVVTFWAVQAAGLVAVPLNAWWTGGELAYAVGDSGMRFVVADGERLAALRTTLRDLDVPALAVRSDQGLARGEDAWEDVLGSIDRDGALPDVAIEPDDDATILYTSGTTGEPKGAVGTNRNHATNLMNTAFGGALAAAMSGASAQADTQTPAPLPVGLQTFPFFHIGGLSGLYISTVFGSRLVLMYRWDPQRALDLIERERVTSVAGVPTVVRSLLETAASADRDLTSLAGVASGGAPVPPDLITRIDADFSSKVSPGNGYGLTETTSAVVANGGRDYVLKPDSVGRPVVVADVRIVSPDTGEDVAPGEVGEVWVRGPNVVRGYWNKAEATASAFTDGWFHSGDLGHFDDAGFLFVVDRMKDVIIRGGENVYCAEVEAVLFEHPAVADVAVVGTPHRSLGEEVVAIIQRRDGTTADGSELQQHVAARLAAFKVPAHVIFRDEPLPRTPTGKVLKRELRDEASALLGA
jgi:long-chain acyl-CoA synthetase